MADDRRAAANYLADSERYEFERRGMSTREVIRVLTVAGVVWLALVVASGGNGIAVGFGWIAGVFAALIAPFVGRWVSGHPWIDPNDPDVRAASDIEERRQSMIGRGRYATDAELMQHAEERAQQKGGPFPGSE